MRKYRSHKVVEAAVIAEVLDGKVAVFKRHGSPEVELIDVPADIFARGQPTIGVDYLVRYADGYISWSPKAAFEEGYDLEP